ncbi:MAG: glycosyltransferase, partial [Candidatus Marsarchaeota archaeon]|nr:glycosyltransferase [Candidatus Marsarchaeota archaeon]
QERGREWMNRRLLEVARVEKPELLFCALFTDELDQPVMREISENTDCLTLNWFCDDHWRFDNYSRYWAPCFNWVVTTAKSALPKYAELGYRNVIKSQWGCSHFLYRKLDLPLEYEVTFVGQPHGNRRQIIQALLDAGIKVQAWGSGWESGRVSQDEMIRIFNQSRINLNLANASVPVEDSVTPRRSTVRGRVSRALEVIPLGRRAKKLGRSLLSSAGNSSPATSDATWASNFGHQYSEQIKGRNFEVPGCGGFMLTGRADNLEDYYELGEEVVCFDDMRDLIEKVRYHLEHEEERAAIAKAGYERTLRDHTYVRRFRQVFQQMGVTWEPGEEILEGRGKPGLTLEIS